MSNLGYAPEQMSVPVWTYAVSSVVLAVKGALAIVLNIGRARHFGEAVLRGIAKNGGLS